MPSVKDGTKTRKRPSSSVSGDEIAREILHNIAEKYVEVSVSPNPVIIDILSCNEPIFKCYGLFSGKYSKRFEELWHEQRTNQEEAGGVSAPDANGREQPEESGYFDGYRYGE